VRIRLALAKFHQARNSVPINAAPRNRSRPASADASIPDARRRVLITKEANMLSWAVTFLIIALIAGVLGLSGVAGTATSIAYVLFVVFLIVAAASFLMGRRPPVT
jgi:uncharacterized membrane protein YtjA (UPF0391 family)